MGKETLQKKKAAKKAAKEAAKQADSVSKYSGLICCLNNTEQFTFLS
jgi:hypothetical protein